MQILCLKRYVLTTIIYKIEVFMDNSEKKRLIDKHSPKTKLFKNSALAFLFGGLICALGEGVFLVLCGIGAEQKTAGVLVTLIFIFAASALTGFGIFDRIAKHAGAGTLVPVTGFSNAVTSQAMDSSSEGVILGVGAKIFTVAGPVILFGISSGVLYGLIYFFAGLIF